MAAKGMSEPPYHSLGQEARKEKSPSAQARQQGSSRQGGEGSHQVVEWMNE